MTRRAVSVALAAALAPGQTPPGKAAYEAFSAWRKSNGGGGNWDETLAAYRNKLRAGGMPAAAIDRTLRAIEAYDEAELYDGIYAGPSTFDTEPNKLLVEAVQGRRPGKALDIAMGQGRNSVFLAEKSWAVTGFDVSEAGIRAARRLARTRSVAIEAVLASDEDFEFGESRWDLIAQIYAIEKRSVHRIRAALKPGGLVVVEAGHVSASGAPFEYASGELAGIFRGFRVRRYEEAVDRPDWGKERIRLVRLIAEKPG